MQKCNKVGKGNSNGNRDKSVRRHKHVKAREIDSRAYLKSVKSSF